VEKEESKIIFTAVLSADGEKEVYMKSKLKMEEERMTRLEIAKGKLERLSMELAEATERAFGHMRQANGQPMNDKRDGHAFMNKASVLEDRCINLVKEIEEQKERVEYLEEVEELKKRGRDGRGHIIMSVDNIPVIKEEIAKMEGLIVKKEHNRYTHTRLRKFKKSLEELEGVTESGSVSSKTRELIDSGKVNQWTKRPVYYFVKGLRKVALEIDENGDFKVSKRYPATTEADKKAVKELLAA